MCHKIISNDVNSRESVLLNSKLLSVIYKLNKFVRRPIQAQMINNKLYCPKVDHSSITHNPLCIRVIQRCFQNALKGACEFCMISLDLYRIKLSLQERLKSKSFIYDFNMKYLFFTICSKVDASIVCK